MNMGRGNKIYSFLIFTVQTIILITNTCQIQTGLTRSQWLDLAYQCLDKGAVDILYFGYHSVYTVCVYSVYCILATTPWWLTNEENWRMERAGASCNWFYRSKSAPNKVTNKAKCCLIVLIVFNSQWHGDSVSRRSHNHCDTSMANVTCPRPLFRLLPIPSSPHPTTHPHV